MKIKFFNQQDKGKKISSSLKVLLSKILKSGNYTNSYYVKRFEDKFKKFVNAKFCIAVNTGTSALHISLITLGIKKGDEVIVPSISFLATAAAVTYVGAKPIFVDIGENDWLINSKKIEEKITTKTKAIIPVHLHGLMCDMDLIKKIAKKNKLFIIEDASQAHGSEFLKKSPGYFGDVATFSFYPTKNLGAVGEGGAIITNNKKIYNRLKDLRNWSPGKDHFSEIGYNYRMPEIIAASLLIKLNYLKKDCQKRIEIANFYKKNLISKNYSTFDNKKFKHTYHIFAVTVSKKKRDFFMKVLKKKGIETAVHYKYSLPNLKIFSYLNKKKDIFPVSTNISNTMISLPIYPELKKRELKYIVKSFNSLHTYV
jgi:dTDP-4-amino-4,6-dideoxygalactose transaminase